MPIHIGHQTRAALVTVGCVGVITIAMFSGLARAAPMGELAPAPAPEPGLAKSSPWLMKVESPAAQTHDGEGRTSDADDADSAQELPIRNRAGGHLDTGRSESGRSTRSLFPADAQVMTPSTSFAEGSGVNEDAAWRAELAHTVREAVRPAYEGLAGSGVLSALRDVESELGLDRGGSFNDSLSDNYSQSGGTGPHAESVSWAGSGSRSDRSDTFSRPRSAAEVADDQKNATVMLEKFLEEILPWVLALFGVYGLGYLVKFSLEYSQWRSARRRRHSRAVVAKQPMRTVRRRHRRHRRRPTV